MMAEITPQIHADLTNEDQQGELATLRLLQQALPEGFAVYHSVHWSREYRYITTYGEIDFVVISPEGKVLLIEQKNGAVEEAGDRLIKRYGESAKDVFNQVQRSIDQLKAKFTQRFGSTFQFNPDYLIYLPDHVVKSYAGAFGSESRIVDATRHLVERVRELLQPPDDPQTGLTPSQVRDVHRFFHGEFEVVDNIHAHSEAHKRRFARFTGALRGLIDNLDFEPYRLRLEGAAGCGKSVAAAHFMRRTSEKGQRALYVCFNRPLADQLQDVFAQDENILVNTFHGLLADVLAELGGGPELPGNPGSEYFDGLVDAMYSADVPAHWQFDALVVDEGQDFKDDWWQVLRLFLAEKARVLWIEDPAQNVMGHELIAHQRFVSYRAPVNYRSTRRIAHFLRSVFPHAGEPGNPLDGRGVHVETYTDDREQLKKLAKIVTQLVADKVPKEDIVVLTCNGRGHGLLAEEDRIGSFTINRVIGRDEHGRERLSGGDIRYDTVRRFKGQERDFVILVDVEPRTEDPLLEQRDLDVLYVGATRAALGLHMLVNAGNRWEEPLSRAAADNSVSPGG